MLEECSGDELWELKSEIQGSPWKTIFVWKYLFVGLLQILNPGSGECFLSGQVDRIQANTTPLIKYKLAGDKFSEELPDNNYEVSKYYKYSLACFHHSL